MGEVFLAEDTRLHRRVALKILPPLVASDPERRRRFEREAQAIAALSHPNIVTIHAVEDVGDTLFLAMELVDGKRLDELIPQDGMPLDRMLRIAIEISDAMAAAQQRGITHRDLKPANVMVTPDGRVKVLDFGLAKLRETEAPAAADDLTRMPTSELTGEGRIVGTVAYMSPEQAEGKPVDPRSDIFSLGVLLHEMATGTRPFKGDTNVSVISAILKDTPPPVSDIKPNLPPDLARIIRRCLAKDPDRRYQTAVDLRNELQDLKEDSSSGVKAVITPPPRARRTRAVWLYGAAAAAVVAIVASALLLKRPQSAAPSTSAGFTPDRFVRLTTSGVAYMANLSPDGRYVVHVKSEQGDPSLWIRQTATSSDVRIIPPARVAYDGVTFSPDGNYVYYNTYPRPAGGVATLYRIPALGGTPTTLVEDVDSGVTFSPDGKQLAFTRGVATSGTALLMTAAVDGSKLRSIATLTPPEKFQSERPAWSPDGKTILASAFGAKRFSTVMAVDVATGKAQAVGGEWGFLRDVQWMPDGRSFLIDAIDLGSTGPTTQIWRVSYPSGERSRVTNDLNSYSGVSLSADGKSLVTVQTETTAGISVAAIQGTGDWRRVTRGASRADGTNGLAWLPDGRIVYSSTASGMPQLWIVDRDGGNARQLTSVGGPALFPSTSLDGRWIYFTAYGQEGPSTFRIAPDGLGIQKVTIGGDELFPLPSPDGRWVYFTRQRSGSPRPGRAPAEGGEAKDIQAVYFRPTGISADGQQLAGIAWDEARRRASFATLPVEGGVARLLPNVPVTAFWAPDGRYYVYTDRTGDSAKVLVQPTAGGPARQVGQAIQDFVAATAISRDGQIAISQATQTSDVILITAANR
jgi:serine/threonine protein kinase